jgi:hypothetical protein
VSAFRRELGRIRFLTSTAEEVVEDDADH